jgi:NAD(P)-dependent dehydrogenase (short-subunit alcohol dehydrogenase family)
MTSCRCTVVFVRQGVGTARGSLPRLVLFTAVYVTVNNLEISTFWPLEVFWCHVLLIKCLVCSSRDSAHATLPSLKRVFKLELPHHLDKTNNDGNEPVPIFALASNTFTPPTMMSLRSSFCWLLMLKDLGASIFTLLFARLLPTIDVPLIDLSDSTAIVTGANSGVGKSLCHELAKRNATVYLACRNVSKGQKVASEIIDACGESSSKRIQVVELDTSSLASVRAFAKSWCSKPVNILIHNAGIAAIPSNGSEVTTEGLGTIYATNFAGAYLLTSLLESSMTRDARIVFTSSVAQYAADYTRILRLPGQVPSRDKQQSSRAPDSGFYADSKFMQVVFVRLLQHRFNSQPGSRIAHAFSPGYSNTGIFEKTPSIPWWVDVPLWSLKAARVLCQSPQQGAAPGLWLAITKDKKAVGEGNGGAYWERCTRRRTQLDVLPESALSKMWKIWKHDTGAEWQ